MSECEHYMNFDCYSSVAHEQSHSRLVCSLVSIISVLPLCFPFILWENLLIKSIQPDGQTYPS